MDELVRQGPYAERPVIHWMQNGDHDEREQALVNDELRYQQDIAVLSDLFAADQDVNRRGQIEAALRRFADAPDRRERAAEHYLQRQQSTPGVSALVQGQAPDLVDDDFAAGPRGNRRDANWGDYGWQALPNTTTAAQPMFDPDLMGINLEQATATINPNLVDAVDDQTTMEGRSATKRRQGDQLQQVEPKRMSTVNRSADATQVVHGECVKRPPSSVVKRTHTMQEVMTTIAAEYPDIMNRYTSMELHARLDQCVDLKAAAAEIIREHKGEKSDETGKIEASTSSRDVQMAIQDNDQPGPSGNSNMMTPTTEELSIPPEMRDFVTTEMRQDISHILSMFPEADPYHVLTERVQNDTQKEAIVDKMMSDGYPKKRDRLAKERKEKRRRDLLDWNAFDIEEFLKIFDNPEAHFMDITRTVSHLYTAHAKVYLMNDNPGLSEGVIERILGENNNHFLPTVRSIAAFGNDYDELTGRRLKRPTTFHLRQINPPHRPFEQLSWPEELDEQFFRELHYHRFQHEIREHQQNEHERRLVRLEIAREAGNLHECPICADVECLADDMLQCTNESDTHRFCRNCVRQHANQRISDGAHRVACMDGGCECEYPTDTLRLLLRPQQFNMLLRRMTREQLLAANLQGMQECPFCDFAIIIENDQERVFRCQNQECLKESCRECKAENHVPLRCAEVENDAELAMRKDVELAMSNALIRVCPKCDKRIIKSDGCNTLTCPCGTTICYVCREQLLPGDPYTHFGNGLHLPIDNPAIDGRSKPRFCPLHTSMDQVHADVAAAAGEAAQQKWLTVEVNGGEMKERPTTTMTALRKKVDVEKLVDRQSRGAGRGRGRMMHPYLDEMMMEEDERGRGMMMDRRVMRCYIDDMMMEEHERGYERIQEENRRGWEARQQMMYEQEIRMRQEERRAREAGEQMMLEREMQEEWRNRVDVDAPQPRRGRQVMLDADSSSDEDDDAAPHRNNRPLSLNKFNRLVADERLLSAGDLATFNAMITALEPNTIIEFGHVDLHGLEPNTLRQLSAFVDTVKARDVDEQAIRFDETKPETEENWDDPPNPKLSDDKKKRLEHLRNECKRLDRELKCKQNQLRINVKEPAQVRRVGLQDLAQTMAERDAVLMELQNFEQQLLVDGASERDLGRSNVEELRLTDGDIDGAVAEASQMADATQRQTERQLQRLQEPEERSIGDRRRDVLERAAHERRETRRFLGRMKQRPQIRAPEGYAGFAQWRPGVHPPTRLPPRTPAPLSPPLQPMLAGAGENSLPLLQLQATQLCTALQNRKKGSRLPEDFAERMETIALRAEELHLVFPRFPVLIEIIRQFFYAQGAWTDDTLEEPFEQLRNLWRVFTETLSGAVAVTLNPPAARQIAATKESGLKQKSVIEMDEQPSSSATVAEPLLNYFEPQPEPQEEAATAMSTVVVEEEMLDIRDHQNQKPPESGTEELAKTAVAKQAKVRNEHELREAEASYRELEFRQQEQSRSLATTERNEQTATATCDGLNNEIRQLEQRLRAARAEYNQVGDEREQHRRRILDERRTLQQTRASMADVQNRIGQLRADIEVAKETKIATVEKKSVRGRGAAGAEPAYSRMHIPPTAATRRPMSVRVGPAVPPPPLLPRRRRSVSADGRSLRTTDDSLIAAARTRPLSFGDRLGSDIERLQLDEPNKEKDEAYKVQ